jgi:23S rRNA pseudouridine955/2504/2580 synthase
VAEDLVAVRKNLRIGPRWAGLSAFEVVRRAFPEVTPREVFRKARAKEVLRNQGPCHPLESVAVGDTVTVVLQRTRPYVPATPLRREEPVETPAGPFWVVWEDDDLLAVGKPPRCASHPALHHNGDTLLDRVRAHLGTRPEAAFQPALANRIDIETSGLVLVGKTRNAQRRLGRHFQKGLVRKCYLTLVCGWPEPAEGQIRRPLVRRPDSRELSRRPPGHPKLRPTLQSAETHYRTAERLRQPLRSALLEIELLTGRTHQIRRHLATRGYPVAGDRRYGDPYFNADVRDVAGLSRMFLHAYRVVLPHPRTGETMDLVAPLPHDLASCLRALGSERPPESAVGRDAAAAKEQ